MLHYLRRLASVECDFRSWAAAPTVGLVTVPSKLTRSVWVGFLQLDEYDESISVHDKVDWQVSALYEGFLDGALPGEPLVDFALDRYAEIMGLPRAALVGTVARIRSLEYRVSTAPGAPPVPADAVPEVWPVYSSEESKGGAPQARPSFVEQQGKAARGFSGFIVDVVLDNTSEDLELLRVRLPRVESVPFPDPQ